MKKVSLGLQKETTLDSKNMHTEFLLAKKRIGTHARLLEVPIKENELLDTWNQRTNLKGQIKNRTLYIHIPFCRLKCLYCGFFKNYHEKERTARYVSALLKDIKMTAKTKYSNSLPLKAVYFGGGTPGVMTPDEIRAVLSTIKENYTLETDCEITFETSVYDLDDEQFIACLESGVNRFSLGVQTFNTKIRQSLGRIDDEKRLINRVEELSTKQDRAAIIIDLIYALPGQTMSMWKYDLDIAISLGIHGFDTYALNLLERSPLAVLIKSGDMPKPPSKGEQLDYFCEAIQKLEKAGMRRLSICHWGKFDLKERNIYNSISKGISGKIPLGAGAGGSIDGWRISISGDIDFYENSILSGIKPITFMSKPHEKYKMMAEIKYQMDKGLVPVEILKNSDNNSQISLLLDDWEKQGFISRARGICEMTLLGQFWHGELTQKLLACV